MKKFLLCTILTMLCTVNVYASTSYTEIVKDKINQKDYTINNNINLDIEYRLGNIVKYKADNLINDTILEQGVIYNGDVISKNSLNGTLLLDSMSSLQPYILLKDNKLLLGYENSLIYNNNILIEDTKEYDNKYELVLNLGNIDISNIASTQLYLYSNKNKINIDINKVEVYETNNINKYKYIIPIGEHKDIECKIRINLKDGTSITVDNNRYTLDKYIETGDINIENNSLIVTNPIYISSIPILETGVIYKIQDASDDAPYAIDNSWKIIDSNKIMLDDIDLEKLNNSLIYYSNYMRLSNLEYIISETKVKPITSKIVIDDNIKYSSGINSRVININIQTYYNIDFDKSNIKSGVSVTSLKDLGAFIYNDTLSIPLNNTDNNISIELVDTNGNKIYKEIDIK